VPSIFISYRRDDTPGYAGRLYDRILREFGRDNVFIDVDALQPGDDFVDAIRDKLQKCDLMLALIGKRWLTAIDEQGRPRLEDEGDYVRIEIQTALDRGLRTIPVLVERAAMPRLQDLPQPLRGLARRQAIELSDTRWEYDVGTLVDTLKRVAPGPAAAAKPTGGREEIEAAAVHSQEEERRQAEAAAAAAETARQEAEAHAERAAEQAREEERERLEAVAQRAREEEQIDLEAEAASARARLADEHRLDKDTAAAADLTQLGERTAKGDTPRSIAIVVLSIAAFGTAIIEALQAFREFVSVPQAFPAGLITTVLLLGIAFVRRDAPRRYRFLIAAGFLLMIPEGLFFAFRLVVGGAAAGAIWTAVDVLRLCTYGCWIAAFAQRGAVRPSRRIVPYFVAAIAIVVAQWSLTRIPLLGALVTLSIAAMAWAAFEVRRRSSDRSLRWASWGTAFMLAAQGFFYWAPSIVTLDMLLGYGHRAVFSLLTNVASWLIAMSVRNETQPRDS
jgi:TIR domain-containing protein